jgi:RNA polymerase subunit RPABC4/transcription elongation factor Spt4
MKENRSSKTSFVCGFCKYQSNLDLRECPECGRTAKQNSEMIAPSVIPAVKPPSRRLIYTCEKCRYQTSNILSECPECGNRNFYQTEVLIKPNKKQNKAPKTDVEQVGKFVQRFGIGLFAIAFLVFWGVGPTGQRYPRSGIIAQIGENWIGAFIIVIVGVAFIIFGSYLKNK